MSSLIPESIIQKIMLYISHPIADLVKNSFEFKVQRNHVDSINHSNIFSICYECGENTDWIRMDVFCDKCRVDVDECVYCGRDLTLSDYDPNFCCRHCS